MEQDNMYSEMSQSRKQQMIENEEHLENMLEYAIVQLEEIARDNDIWLVRNGEICSTYDKIFDCLKEWSIRRKDQSKQ